jgi:hypothetical protein
LLVLISGIASAYYWHKSSKVMIMPMVIINGKLVPLNPLGDEAVWISSLYQGIHKAGGLSKKAAIFTALAVILSSATSLLSLYATST